MTEKNIFEKGDIRLTYLKLALPVVLGMVSSIVYNIADTYFISRTQNTALVAGVSLCAPVFTVIMAFGNIFGQGGMSLISRLFGKGDMANVKRVSAFCFYTALATGAVLAALLLVLRGPALGMLGADEETFAYASQYFTVLAAGAPLILVSFIHTNLLRSEGFASLSMAATMAGLLLNVILDPVMITGMGMGASGAALASVLGYVLQDVMLLVFVLRKSKMLSVDPSLIRISPSYAGQIFSVGISAALANWMSSLCLIITNNFLLTYGNDKIAAMGIAQKVLMIVLLLIVGFSFGGAPIYGYYYGGRRMKELKRLIRFVLCFLVGMSLILSCVLFLAAEKCVGVFLEDPSVMEAGVFILRCQISTMCLAAVVQVIIVIYQASGRAAEALIVSLMRQGIVFLAVIFIAGRLAGYHGVICAQPVSDILTFVLAGSLFLKRYYLKLEAADRDSA